ncbi:MAG: site-specific DNA-methyltransferase, partial [Promethearchaeota archaeon]
MLNNRESSKKGTKTSSFGVSKRESHDSSQFYNSNLYKNLKKLQKVKYLDNFSTIPKKVLDHVILGDSRKMDLIPDNSVH